MPGFTRENLRVKPVPTGESAVEFPHLSGGLCCKIHLWFLLFFSLSCTGTFKMKIPIELFTTLGCTLKELGSTI